jgi:hypothetical protein
MENTTLYNKFEYVGVKTLELLQKPQTQWVQEVHRLVLHGRKEQYKKIFKYKRLAKKKGPKYCQETQQTDTTNTTNRH